MDRIITMLLFIIVFIIIYGGINFYVLYRLFGMLELHRGIVFITAILLATLSLPLATVAEKYIASMATRILYIASSLWSGMLIFLVSFLLVYEVLRLLLKISPGTSALAIIIITIVLSIISVVNARDIYVRHIELPMQDLEKDTRIVQLSDIHLGTIRNSHFLKKIVQMTNSEKPAVVVITGDLIDGSAPLSKELLHELDNISAPIFFVTGNHEVYEGLDAVYGLLAKTQVIVFNDQMIEYEGIQFVGISYSENLSRVQKALAKIKLNKDKPSILLYHEPRGMQAAKEAGIALMITGHTHSGQIFPFNLLTMIAYPKINGLYNLSGMYLYVSPGTGTWGPYMRLGSRNEITVFNLKKK